MVAHSNLFHTGRNSDKDLRILNTISIRNEGPTIGLGNEGKRSMVHKRKLGQQRREGGSLCVSE